MTATQTLHVVLLFAWIFVFILFLGLLLILGRRRYAVPASFLGALSVVNVLVLFWSIWMLLSAVTVQKSITAPREMCLHMVFTRPAPGGPACVAASRTRVELSVGVGVGSLVLTYALEVAATRSGRLRRLGKAGNRVAS
jgi:hypothetical protein